MTWVLYDLSLQLGAPLHVGWKKQGSLQSTYPYVHGRALWGALTSAVASLENAFPAPQDYIRTGEALNEQLALFYLYPAIQEDSGQWRVFYPGDEEMEARLLDSYTASARDAVCGSTQEGSLHEVETICRHDKASGCPVFLKGHIGERQGCNLPWRQALHIIQLGGERGYGFGRIQSVSCKENTNGLVFDMHQAIPDQPYLHIDLRKREGSPNLLLAHSAIKLLAEGSSAPFVGRMWRNQAHGDGPGRSVEYHGCWWQPGSVILKDQRVRVGRFGLWELAAEG